MTPSPAGQHTQTLVGRLALGASLSAALAALVAAAITGVLAVVLLQEAEDRRLTEAAVILGEEVPGGPLQAEAIAAIVEEETEETSHAGLLFAVFDVDGKRLAGDPRIHDIGEDGCDFSLDGQLRRCTTHFHGTQSHLGYTAVAAAGHTAPVSVFALAALIAAFLAAVGAWGLSRPLARRVLAPLAQLRRRLAGIDHHAVAPVDLGPPADVLEVDELRSTAALLLTRLQTSMWEAQRFAANAAHELRTPLTSARAELELLSEEEDTHSETTRERLARVERKVGELSTLVERLLVLAMPRVAADGREASELVSLRDVVEEVLASFSPAEVARVTTDDGDAQVMGDPVLLMSMVSNGIGNALKFADHARVSVVVSGPMAIITIVDDGAGIDVAEREQVFAPFYRSPAALKRRLPGQGLGLAMVRHIAEMHGGSASLLVRDPGVVGAALEMRVALASNGAGDHGAGGRGR